MSTYLPQITDYLPQVQPFNPNYDFYANVLNFKQTAHDANVQQINSLYGSLLNAPLTRDDNIQTRDQFFKMIEQDIKKISRMDLSLKQNSNAAMGVFNRLLDSQNITKDMVWTRQFNKELQRSEGFKNCVDPTKCGGSWWAGGDRLLGYQREDFKNATPDQAMNMGFATYVPYQDITKQALALTKEADLNISQDIITGQWITTIQNGPIVKDKLHNLFMGAIGSDPKVLEYYQAQAEVNRRDFMAQNEMIYGSQAAAEQAYIQEMQGSIQSMLTGTTTEIEDKIAVNEAKQAKIAEAYSNSMPDERQSLSEMYDQFNYYNTQYASSLEYAQQAEGNIQVAANNQGYTGAQIDAVVSSLLLMSDINGIADIMSYRNYKQTQKVNPYALEATRQRNRMMLEEYKWAKKAEYEQMKQIFEEKEEQITSTGSAEYNIPTPVDVKGGTASETGNEKSYENLNKGYTQFEKHYKKQEADLSRNEKEIISELLKITRLQAEGGDVQAKEDYVNLVQSYVNLKTNPEELLFAPEPESTPQLSRTYTKAVASAQNKALLNNTRTLDEKYNIAKNIGTIDLNELSGRDVDNLYDANVAKMLDPTDEVNQTLRPYLLPYIRNNKDKMYDIEAKNLILDQMDATYLEQVELVIQKAEYSSEYPPLYTDAFKAYFNDKGGINDKETFIANMKAMNYSEAEARDLWGYDQRLKIGEFITDEGKVDRGFWHWLGDAGGSFVDTLVQIGPVSNIVKGTADLFGADVQYFDFDSPRDAANWGAPGSGERDDDLARGKPGIHDLWKRAFSEFAEPKGDSMMLGINGAGNEVIMGGLNYAQVDPDLYNSNATLGTIGILKDAFNTGTTIYDFGELRELTPEDSDDDAKRILQMVYSSMINDKGKKNRVIPNVTYAHIAGSDANLVGFNVKLDGNYVDKNRVALVGPKDDQIMDPSLLTTEGVTFYLPKANATNIFTQGAEKTGLDVIMGYRGTIDINTYPKVSPDFTIKLDQALGQYIASGKIAVGIKPDGTYEWQAYYNPVSYSQKLEDIVADQEAMLAYFNEMLIEMEKEFKANNYGGQ